MRYSYILILRNIGIILVVFSYASENIKMFYNLFIFSIRFIIVNGFLQTGQYKKLYNKKARIILPFCKIKFDISSAT